jgi:SAM-dependent methyltransferase
MAWKLPRFARRQVLHFETAIAEAVAEFAAGLPDRARVLDAGAGEAQYASFFRRQRYCAVDLGVGDSEWNYGELDAISDLAALPFPADCFDACLNIVTLEHVREPARVLQEIARTLRPGGRILLVVPHEWEVHQAPHDYFRYTRYGVAHLLSQAGLKITRVSAVGGFFRLLARRMLNGLQFFCGGVRWVFFPPAALLLVPPALVLPALDFLDREHNFTLGYICTAHKP